MSLKLYRWISLAVLLVGLLIPQVSAHSGNVSLDLQEVPVRSVLQAIAQTAGCNMVIMDSVQGTITIHLHEMPWQDALQLVLKTQGLSKRNYGFTLLIGPSAEIALHETQALQAEQAILDVAPLSSETIVLRYAKASDIAVLLTEKSQHMLSSRGSITADPRTNAVLLQDNPEKRLAIRTLIQSLDIPAPQISIEARLVNIDQSYEKNLGIRFDVQKNIALTQNTATSEIQNPLDHMHFDGNVMHPGSGPIGMAMINLGSGFLLDLELSALEQEGMGEVISRPHLVTSNQQAAEIQSGAEIPYQETAGNGATSVTIKKAVLSLEVLPRITANNTIALDLKVHQDKPSQLRVEKTPAIDTRVLSTQVVVRNGETLVLGGIYEQIDAHQMERVPFLSTLPIIGALFRHTAEQHDRRELLIFVTPTILAEAPASQTHKE